MPPAYKLEMVACPRCGRTPFLQLVGADGVVYNEKMHCCRLRDPVLKNPKAVAAITELAAHLGDDAGVRSAAWNHRFSLACFHGPTLVRHNLEDPRHTHTRRDDRAEDGARVFWRHVQDLLR